jgi:hypothetical protein
MKALKATAFLRQGRLRGLAECRRAIEKRLSPEHYALATLVDYRGEAVTQLTHHPDPDVVWGQHVARFAICSEAGRSFAIPAVLLSGAVQ